ncbi:hypothetical protein N7462_003921 [Penicillium macrosclerotiorum]|uniref:uncharacterized protein n=1 Tax=Penicillium macrosclerotiorum TaxID=303699 RepID=UPI0025496A03|nr:uncharacterized protein N7462_003921 [Penicillium macrosclerotiorum]KAJ5689529.1 hypothetical protein N7462_003921 [Penicillium macrosclerotiorum]
MSPTLASIGGRVGNTVRIGFLVLWTAAAVAFAAIDFVDPSWNIIDPLISTSLLTYLVCRLIVACQRNPHDGSMAFRLANAGRRSRSGAFAMLLVCGAWLFELFFKILWMFLLTILGTAIMMFHVYGDTVEEIQTISGPKEDDIDFAAARKQLEEFKETMGFDPLPWLGWIPPNFLICGAIVAWISFCTLGLYVLRRGWKSLKVLFAPVAASAPASKFVV